jgi:hypothetical protein
MPSKTLIQLRQDARRASGLTADADAVPDLTLNEYINQSWHELYDLIIDADDGLIFAKNATNPPSGGGKHDFKLPADMYRLVSCDIRNGEYYIPAQKADVSEYAQLADDRHALNAPKYYLRFDMISGQWFIFIFPAPAINTIAITYIRTPKELSTGADSLANPASWLSFVTYGAAIKMLNQLERDASAQLIELKRIGQRVADSVSDLDVNSPSVVQDTDGRFGGGGGYGFQ